MTLDELSEKLKQTLPGENSHIPFLPPKRPLSSISLKSAANYKESAVAIIIYKQNYELHSVLIKRNIYNGIHSGQISFPGGKKEYFDTSFKQTAIRESTEEIGLKGNLFESLGKLTPVYIPVSNFRVHPFVFYYNDIPIFKANEREVSEILTFPISLLLRKEVQKKTEILLPDKKTFQNLPFFDINNEIVWGATAMIINEFKRIMER